MLIFRRTIRTTTRSIHLTGGLHSIASFIPLLWLAILLLATSSPAQVASKAGHANHTSHAEVATPTITLVSSNNPAMLGFPVTLTATVTGAGATPTGVVYFMDDTTPIADVTLSGGIATYTTSRLVLGEHPITANYGGDTNYTSAIASLTEVIQPAVVIALTPSLAAGSLGTPYSQTITASGGIAPYTYAITSGSLPAGLSLNSSGTVSGTPTASGSFPVTVTATDSSQLTGSQSYILTIAQNAVTVALAVTAAGNPATTVAAGTPVTLTATVLASGSPIGPGLVNFCDATAAHCTGVHIVVSAQLTSAGTASTALIPGVGSHSYSAMFVGKRGYAAGASSADTLNVTVTQSGILPSATGLTSSGAQGSYTIDANVGGNNGVLPTGTVSFVDATNGNAPLGMATLGTAGGFGFGISSFSPAGLTLPTSNVVADFNGDGILDMAVAGSTAVTILLGNGDGTFTQHGSISGYGYMIVAADFKSDGAVDLAVSEQNGNPTMVALGDGHGNFSSFQTVGTGASSITVGDFNNDGIPDLVGVPGVVLLGNGDGTFTQVQNSGVSGGEFSMVTADFNGDGNLDLATQSSSSQNLEIFLGNGDGTFTASASSPIGSGDPGLAVTDFNNDGIPDLFTGQGVLLGNGNGTFTALSPVTGQVDQPYYFAVGDFNLDGNADYAAASFYGNDAAVALGNGSGSFPDGAGFTTDKGPYWIAVGDLNGDGTPDLVIPNANSNDVTVALTFLENAQATEAVTLAVATGTHQIIAKYSGDAHYAASTATIALASAMGTPTVTIAPSSNPAASGTPLTFTITVSGAGLMPTGSVIISDDGRQLGAPTLSSGAATYSTSSLTLGQHTITAAYSGDTNYSPVTATLTENIQTTIAVTLAPASLPSGMVGTAYSQALSASGGTAPYTYAVSTGTMPAGLALTTAGVLSGVPTASGSASFTITATDSSTGKYTGSQAYTLVITPAPTITLAPASLPAGIVGTPYSQTFSASGGTAPYVYSVSTGSLPAGLTLSPGGVLSDTPTASGSYTVTITATDSSAAKYSGSQSYTVVINAAPTITLAPTSLPTGVVGTAYSQTFSASGGTSPYTYSLTNTSLPAGLTLSSSGVLSGTPTAASASTLTVTATDSSTGMYSGSQTYMLTIFAAPSITVGTTSSPTQTVAPGSAATFGFNVSAGQSIFTDPVNFSATGLPPGATATFNPSSFPAGSSGGPVSLTIQTASTASALRWPGGNTALGLLVLPLLGLRRVRRRVRLTTALSILAFAAFVSLNGCGGGSTPVQTNPTTYTVTIKITSGSLVQTTAVTLDVN